MPLNEVKLTQDLEGLYDIMLMTSQFDDPEAPKKNWAKRMTQIIADFVRSGDVATTGTAAAQKGKVL